MHYLSTFIDYVSNLLFVGSVSVDQKGKVMINLDASDLDTSVVQMVELLILHIIFMKDGIMGMIY